MYNRKLMRVVIWLMIIAMLFSTVMFAVTAVMGY